MPVKQFDYIVGMGCKDSCLNMAAKENVEWVITDPKGKDIDFFRKTRDEIKEKVEELVENIEQTR
ncbi:MAG: hypothetical protein V1739_05050 [Candidatus Omnitrophota bacterium]